MVYYAGICAVEIKGEYKFYSETWDNIWIILMKMKFTGIMNKLYAYTCCKTFIVFMKFVL